MTTKKDYNALALRGVAITDMEYVLKFGLDPDIANTPKMTTAMLDLTYQDNIDNGVPLEKAKENRASAERDIKILLAKRGML